MEFGKMKRRDFLTIAAAGVTAASFNVTTTGRANTSEIYKLRAGEANANLISDGSSSENCWLFNASCPGPLLRRRYRFQTQIRHVMLAHKTWSAREDRNVGRGHRPDVY